MSYYYLTYDDDLPVRHGPYTLDELRRQPLTPYTLVWHDELPDWESAANQPELHSLFPTVDAGRLERLAPPPPNAPVSFGAVLRTCLFIGFGVILFLVFLFVILIFWLGMNGGIMG